MAILRKHNKEQFTSIPQEIFRDERLSLKDIGLLVSMLSLPDNWNFSENGLETIFKNDGQSSIRAGLKKLEQAGYLKRERTRDKTSGRMSAVNWYLYESPQCENPQVENPQVEKPPVENPHLDNPHLDNPRLENPPQSNTKQSTTKESKTKKPNTHANGFEEFWTVYPKKRAKEDARRAWNKLKPDEDLQKTIIQAVNTQKRSKDWTKDGGQFIPYPASWLNGRRWEDETGQHQQQEKQTFDPHRNPYEEYL